MLIGIIVLAALLAVALGILGWMAWDILHWRIF